MQTQTKIIIISIVVVLIVIGYYANSKMYKAAPVETVPTAALPVTTPKGTTEIKGNVARVSIANFAFTPQDTSIKVGDSITWVNNDSVPHSITWQGFMSPVIQRGGEFTYVFKGAGSIKYNCGIHPSMSGLITIK